MEDKLNKLKELLARVQDLNEVSGLLSWDMETYMPPGGGLARAQQMATLSKLSHEFFVADEVGQLLEDLRPYEQQLDSDSDEASLIRVARRRYEKEVRVPTDLVGRLAEARGRAQPVWAKAKDNADFASFLPELENTLELTIEYASIFDEFAAPYDALLDNFEPGMTGKQVEQIFGPVRAEVDGLSAQIAANADAVSDAIFQQPYDEKKQLAFSEDLARMIGYDFERGRQDLSAHPFTSSFAHGDVRITTWVFPGEPMRCWAATMHEAGHAIHRQGIPQEYDRTPLTDYDSLGVGESQSRLYENMVGRSLPFWEYVLPTAQKYFPDQLGKADALTLYRAANKSGPSFIRVEADEVTYGLHIILRFEIEQAMVNREVELKDLPDLWNSKMQELLGITPPSDKQGVLQDIHWSMGYMGYFPTYLLGSIFSAQLFESIRADMPDIDDQIRRGEFGNLQTWLGDKVHSHGGKYGLTEIAPRATGRELTSVPFVDYLKAKYSELYGL